VLEGREEGHALLLEEGSSARCTLPDWMVPAAAREGDSIVIDRETTESGGVTVNVRLDASASRARREEAESRLRRLRARDLDADRS
jgi:hypothetical protein